MFQKMKPLHSFILAYYYDLFSFMYLFIFFIAAEIMKTDIFLRCV